MRRPKSPRPEVTKPHKTKPAKESKGRRASELEKDSESVKGQTDSEIGAPKSGPEPPARVPPPRSEAPVPGPDEPPAETGLDPIPPGPVITEHPDPPPGTARHYNKRRQALRQIVSALLQAGMGTDEIIKHAVEQYPGTTTEQARAAYYEILHTWHEQFEEDQPRLKAAQIERIRRDLTRLRAQANPNWAAICKLEDMFARLAGTFEPAKVQVDVGVEVQRSVLAVVATLTEAEQESLIQEQLALEAKVGTFPAANSREPVAAE